MTHSTKRGELQGKVLFIAGAGRQIGQATALVAAREGARIALIARKTDITESVAQSIRAGGGDAISIRCDLTLDSEVDEAVEETVRRLGPINSVFYNAASYPADPRQDVFDLDEDSWRASRSVTLGGAISVARAIVPSMLQRGGGTFVLTSSGCSLYGEEVHLDYAVSKAGINALTRYLASRYGRHGIRANAIMPFVMAGERGAATAALTCLGRSGTADEIGEAVVFLCSERSSIITGQEIHLDGGLQTKAHWGTSFAPDAPASKIFSRWSELVDSSFDRS